MLMLTSECMGSSSSNNNNNNNVTSHVNPCILQNFQFLNHLKWSDP